MPNCNRTTVRDRYFLVIANAAGEIIHFNDAEGPIRWVNQATESLLGYSPGELTGHPAIEIIHPDDRETVLGAVASTAAGLPVSIREIRLEKKDSTLIEAKMSTFNFKVDGQKRAGAVLRDVSEKREIESELEKNCALVPDLKSTPPKLSKNVLGKSQVAPDVLPICAYCNKVRNQDGAWISLGIFLKILTNTNLSHGICPECVEIHYPGFAQNNNPSAEDD